MHQCAIGAYPHSLHQELWYIARPHRHMTVGCTLCITNLLCKLQDCIVGSLTRSAAGRGLCSQDVCVVYRTKITYGGFMHLIMH